MKSISIGDVVLDLRTTSSQDSGLRLSDPYLKTVEKIDGEQAECVWHSDGGGFHREWASISNLVAVELQHN